MLLHLTQIKSNQQARYLHYFTLGASLLHFQWHLAPLMNNLPSVMRLTKPVAYFICDMPAGCFGSAYAINVAAVILLTLCNVYVLSILLLS